MLGEIELIVGLVSPTLTLPPRDTALPLIVIDELAREELGILAAVMFKVSALPSLVSVSVIPVLPVAVSLAPSNPEVESFADMLTLVSVFATTAHALPE